MVTGPRKSGGYTSAQLSDSDWVPTRFREILHNLAGSAEYQGPAELNFQCVSDHRTSRWFLRITLSRVWVLLNDLPPARLPV